MNRGAGRAERRVPVRLLRLPALHGPPPVFVCTRAERAAARAASRPGGTLVRLQASFLNVATTLEERASGALSLRGVSLFGRPRLARRAPRH